MAINDDLSADLLAMAQAPAFEALLTELRSGLQRYWETADLILRPCGVTLQPPAETAFSFAKNFFSQPPPDWIRWP